MNRIAERLWRSQEFEERRCGTCGVERPKSEPFYAAPPGWQYVLVRSGINPVYKWKCPDCQKFGVIG